MSATAETHETRPLLSVRQVAERANVSRAHVYRLIASGELPAIRVGGAVRVDPAELEQWLFAQPRDAA